MARCGAQKPLRCHGRGRRRPRITDVGAAYLLLRLSGARIRDTLAKLLPIDLHPRTLRVGAVVRSVAAHVAVLLWRLDDEAGHAVFEMATPRSSAANVCHALSLEHAQSHLNRVTS